jgi:hypothetical protein
MRAPAQSCGIWRKRVRRLAGAAALLGGWFALGVSAQTDSDPVRALASTLPGRIERAHLRVVGIAVGEHSIDDVIAQLGPASRFAPTGGDAVVAVCYAAGSSRRAVAVMFQAQGEAPSVVSLALVAPRGALLGEGRHCASLPVLAEELTTQAGVALGMSRTELMHRFSQPPSEHTLRALGFYYYQPLDVAAGSEERCQLLSGLRARLGAHECVPF